ncbi:hypothetical protein PLESTB_001737500 [Pleodorina starrii]|uniref:Uncharacterized protein n=1 Tax=Pleodorina starrii TaxID=330485 RepID=A0A9W6C0J6_9CHLO|nr:hypothetical protein PLESTM_000745700 [Pleodorina starrii]GLC61265.1 hypothetical protein PLESTB_001737500 [Pleodorina starrii]GLC74729.1 hypothetical protein PLESTF_001549100 [Pleodorina starrii]
MKCIRRAWRPKLTTFAPAVFRGRLLREAFLQPLPALKTSTTGGAPLSLNDIIAFESELPSLVVQEAVPERRVDELIDRAARVLREVNSVLEAESSANDQLVQQQQQGEGEGSSPDATHGSVSPLSRAVFGGSAQVSEREASITRQALQKTLEAVPPSGSRHDAAPPGAGVGTGRPTESAAAAAVEAQERPAWAQALFSSSNATSTPSTSPSSSSSPSAASITSWASGSASPSSSSPPSSSSAAGNPSDRPGAPPSRGSNPQRSEGGAAARSGPASSSSPPYPAPPSRSSAPPPPQLQPAPAPSRRPLLAAWAPLAYAEVDLSMPTELLLKSEDSLWAEKARSAVLPPLQSVVDLTAAVRPPTRGLDLDLGHDVGPAAAGAAEAVSAAVAVTEEEVVQGGALGRRLQDGAGRLADGTRFEKLSGTDTGPDGYVKKWEVLRGVTGDGQVQWEECWWQASNRYGLRELGAFKKGTTESGAAWVEEWKEVLHTHPTNLRLVIERTAHKWARDENADEWEEKWGECFEEAGRVHKYADKWAKAGSNVWHERWGEDYDGRGACQKWTDKWAERLLPDGGQEQWGDKWTETFGHGKGTKHGEVWSSSGGGSRYNRWWNEEHFGDGRVRKWGNSTSGEYWDTVEHMDTYYNPVPHFGFQHAVCHSPQLWAVPLPTPEEGDGGSGGDDDDGLGVGLGRL